MSIPSEPEVPDAAKAENRVVLFLEGPASPFLRRVADHVLDGGHDVRHIDFCLGDRVFWTWLTGLPLGRRRPAPRSDSFRGPLSEWPGFLSLYLEEHRVSDVVMLGDGRPVHACAVEVAMAAGVRVHVLEHGYLRPDWLTLEPDGMSSHSRMPRDPDVLRRMAVGLPPVDTQPLWRSSFLVYALYDFAYHLPNVFLGPFVHPHYRTHGPVHPLVEYGGWIAKWLARPFERRHLARILPSFIEGSAPYFLFALQLPGDYQILRHAPGGDLFALVEATISSFAEHADPADRLLFKVHPLDNGLSGWRRRIGRLAKRSGVATRVEVVDGGPLDVLIARSKGVVLANSTVGITTLAAGRPLFALGNAVFDIPGLTQSGSLAGFWRDPIPPDRDLVDAFLRVLADRIQIRGGFIGHDAIEAGAVAVATRLLESRERLPVTQRQSRIPQFRHENEITQRRARLGQMR